MWERDGKVKKRLPAPWLPDQRPSYTTKLLFILGSRMTVNIAYLPVASFKI